MGFFSNVGGSLSDLIKDKLDVDHRFDGDPQIWMNYEQNNIFTVRGFTYADGQFSEERVSAGMRGHKTRMILRFSYSDVVDAIFRSVNSGMRHIIDLTEIKRLVIVPEFNRDYQMKIDVQMEVDSKYSRTLHRESFPICVTDAKWKETILKFESECNIKIERDDRSRGRDLPNYNYYDTFSTMTY